MFKYVSLLIFALLAAAVPNAPRQSCADVTVVFARGTFETPLIGTVVGPPFRSALQAALGSQTLNFIGVDYPADVQGFEEGGDPNGAKTMAADVTSAANTCPDTKIVMSGYSQGAQLTHLASGEITSSVANRVNAVVMFGDPDNGQPLAGGLNDRSLTFCAQGDDICEGGQTVTAAHLSYGADAGAAANFVVQHIS